MAGRDSYSFIRITLLSEQKATGHTGQPRTENIKEYRPVSGYEQSQTDARWKMGRISQTGIYRSATPTRLDLEGTGAHHHNLK